MRTCQKTEKSILFNGFTTKTRIGGEKREKAKALSNPPFYYDYRSPTDASYWWKSENRLIFKNMDKDGSIFMFAVVEISKNQDENINATVLAAKMWFSNDQGKFAMPGPVGTEYEDDFYMNIISSSMKTRKKQLGWDANGLIYKTYQVNIDLNYNNLFSNNIR